MALPAGIRDRNILRWVVLKEVVIIHPLSIFLHLTYGVMMLLYGTKLCFEDPATHYILAGCLFYWLFVKMVLWAEDVLFDDIIEESSDNNK